MAGHLGLVGASAVLLGLSFPQPGWWPLAYVALVPLGVLAVRSAEMRRLAWSSLLVFSLWWLVRIHWLMPVTVWGYVSLSLFMGCYGAAALVLLQFIHRKYRSPMVLTLPLVWVSVEFVRGRFPLGGFAWFTLGHSQAAYDPAQSAGKIIQSADLFGELTVSFIVAMTSGLLVDMLTRPWYRSSSRGRTRLRRAMRGGLVLWSVTFFAAWWYGYYRLHQSDQTTCAGPRIMVIQTNVPQDNKNFPTADQLAADWRDLLERTRRAAQAGPKPDLIVWPETMVPAPLNPEALEYYGAPQANYHEQIQAMVQSIGTHLLAGSHASEDWVPITAADGSRFKFPRRRANSVYLYDPDGAQSPARYDKVHRVPFGEYIPWVSAFPALKRFFIKYLSPYPFDYSLVAGSGLTIFELARSSPISKSLAQPTRIVTPICYEDADSRLCRRMVWGHGRRADLLVNLTNSAWYRGGSQRLQHLQIAVLRSIENRVPSARSVNSGISGFIDSAGRIGPLVEVAGRRQEVAGFAATRVRLDVRTTLYGRVGQVPVVAMALATVALVLGGLLRSNRSHS